MGYKYERDVILIGYNLMKGDNYLKFIRLEHDGDYSLKHQMELSKGKTYLWQGTLPDDIRERFVNKLNEKPYDPLDDIINRIWRIKIDGYELDDVSASNKTFPDCYEFDPAKVLFEETVYPAKLCKHCGNIYMPDYDFIEDEVMCEHLNSMFGGTYEYPAEWPDYCSNCLEELYDLDTAKSVYDCFKEKDVIK